MVRLSSVFLQSKDINQKINFTQRPYFVDFVRRENIFYRFYIILVNAWMAHEVEFFCQEPNFATHLSKNKFFMANKFLIRTCPQAIKCNTSLNLHEQYGNPNVYHII